VLKDLFSCGRKVTLCPYKVIRKGNVNDDRKNQSEGLF